MNIRINQRGSKFIIARLTEEMELDDEISQLYLKKNVDKFWKK